MIVMEKLHNDCMNALLYFIITFRIMEKVIKHIK